MAEWAFLVNLTALPNFRWCVIRPGHRERAQISEMGIIGS